MDSNSSFNAEQLAAIETTAKHVLVLAGAGTGKTTTIVGRCNHLIRSGVPEREILLITFTRRAAHEIRSRIRGPEGKRSLVTASTFHSWAMRLIRNNPNVFKLESPSLIDRDDVITLLQRYRKTHASQNLPKARDLADFHSLLVNTRLPAEEAAKLAGIDEDKLSQYTEASKFYVDFKRSRNYIDYDDVLERVAEEIARPAIAKAIGKRFSHVMIDEMQDTNPLQYLIVDALAPHVNLFCVGDDAQSIYGFRGADFESIHAFTSRYPDAVVLKLQENFRSTQEILDVSNWLLERSPLEYDKELRAARGAGQKPILREFEDQWSQADYVAETIVTSFCTEQRWANNMVLVRSGYSARAVESEFLSRKIPHVLIGGQSLFGAKHVKDVMALLRIYANRWDELAWMRYLQLWKGIGEVTAERIFRQLALGAEDSVGRGRNTETPLLDMVRDAKASDSAGWTEPLLRCLTASSKPDELLGAVLDAMEKPMAKIYRNDHWDARRRDFTYIRQLAKKHRTVHAFVDEYSLNPVYEKQLEKKGETDLVKIITIHSAKGLEAQRCFVVDVARGTFPQPGLTEKEAEEERRVLYVALTRAADELHITRAERGWTASGSSKGDEAYFLDGLPLELVAYVTEPESDPDAGIEIRF